MSAPERIWVKWPAGYSATGLAFTVAGIGVREEYLRADTAQFALSFRAGIEAAEAQIEDLKQMAASHNESFSDGYLQACQNGAAMISNIPTPGDPLAAALALPEVRALVDAAEKFAKWDQCWPGNMNLEMVCQDIRAALAAMKEPGQ